MQGLIFHSHDLIGDPFHEILDPLVPRGKLLIVLFEVRDGEDGLFRKVINCLLFDRRIAI